MVKDRNEVKASGQGMRSALSNGDPGMILPFCLYELEQKQPGEVPALLDSIISIQEQRLDTISLLTLIFLRSFYLKETTPRQLQTRFLTMAFNTVLPASTSPERMQVAQAYD